MVKKSIAPAGAGGKKPVRIVVTLPPAEWVARYEAQRNGRLIPSADYAWAYWEVCKTCASEDAMIADMAAMDRVRELHAAIVRKRAN